MVLKVDQFFYLFFTVLQEKNNTYLLKIFCFLPCSLPLTEIRVHHPIGETFTTYTNTLKHTVTGQLVHNKMGIDNTGLLKLVGDDTAHEMRMCRVEGVHQLI